MKDISCWFYLEGRQFFGGGKGMNLGFAEMREEDQFEYINTTVACLVPIMDLAVYEAFLYCVR